MRDESFKLLLFFVSGFYYCLLYGLLQTHCFPLEAGVAVCHRGLERCPQMPPQVFITWGLPPNSCDWLNFLNSLHLNSHLINGYLFLFSVSSSWTPYFEQNNDHHCLMYCRTQWDRTGLSGRSTSWFILDIRVNYWTKTESRASSLISFLGK